MKIPVYSFSPFGGLGDLIIQSYRPLPYINSYAYNGNPTIVVYGDFICPTSREYFLDLPPTALLHGSSSICPSDIQKDHNKHHLFEEQFLPEFLEKAYLSHEFTINKHHLNPTEDLTPRPLERYISLREKEIWNQEILKGKPVTIIANIARVHNRSIPASTLLGFIRSDTNYIQIGKVSEEDRSKYELKLPNVLSLLNKTTINQALAYIDKAQTLVCCDSCFMCYGKMTRKPMRIILPHPEHPKYGFKDKSKREDYFSCFDHPDTIVYDFNYNKLN